MSSSRKKDQGYAWVIVILAFICHTVVWGLMWTIGIWTTKFETVFGQSKTYTSFVGSGINATNYVAGKIFFASSSISQDLNFTKSSIFSEKAMKFEKIPQIY